MNLRIIPETSSVQRVELNSQELLEWDRVKQWLEQQGWEHLLIHFTDGTQLYHKAVPDLTKKEK